ncbi:MAG: D-aminoacyl-tRNA deacylase [Thermoplasmata archaeon]
MRLIVSSKEDEASQNILEHLLKLDWEEIDEWKDNPVYKKGDDYIATVNRHHIYVDKVDKELEELLDIKIDHVVYISKHSSKAGIHSLTVHPIGNIGEAKFGGIENKLVPAAPVEMTAALRTLWSETRDKGLENEYDVSFEATHHGPYLETPTYYIEIGSDKGAWNDERAGQVIANTVMNVGKNYRNDDVVICIGGGHYAPRYTDLARKNAVSIGHMVPGWGMKYLTHESFNELVEKTSGVKYVYFDRSSTSGKERRRVKDWSEEEGLSVVRSDDLEKL